MKCANIGTVLNFDLCDLEKVGQIKNPGIMSSILIRCTYDKNLEMIQPLVQENSTLLVFKDGHLAAIFEVRSGRNSVEM
jgi:predicted transcriptional regulator